MRIVVLGAGRVGSAIAVDLAAEPDFRVTVVDRDAAVLDPLRPHIHADMREVDLSDPGRVLELAREHDLVVGAVPAHMGFETVRAALDAGRHVVDISFFEEDALALDDLARSKGVVAAVDAGVSPGLSNMILGHLQSACDRVTRYVCYVGGLPEDRSGLFHYKAPFSPADVIEVYTRPARYKASGEICTAPALTGIEKLTVPEVGVLEGFVTDGLRTLLADETVPDMRELTLRYPGHAGQMRLLSEMGLFDTDPVEVAGVSLPPRALTAQLLFPHWEFAPGEPDFTALRVEVDTVSDGRAERHVYDMLDRYDAATGISSMGRTTGYTCTAIVRLVASGDYAEAGISPLERVGRAPGCFDRVVDHLAARGVVLHHSAEPIATEEGK